LVSGRAAHAALNWPTGHCFGLKRSSSLRRFFVGISLPAVNSIKIKFTTLVTGLWGFSMTNGR
jgi:hypothetical protein